MNTFTKLAATAIIGTILALTVKKQNADMALVIILATGAVILSEALGYLAVVVDFWEDLETVSRVTGAVAGPLLKAVGITVIMQIASAVCRDSGESALAVKLDLCGIAACIIVMIPLLSEALMIIASLI